MDRVRAALFDVGDTLVEHWATHDVMRAKRRDRLADALGEAEWIEELVDADLDADVTPAEAKVSWPYLPEHTRQETLRWYERWFRERAIQLDRFDADQVRALLTVPLDQISSPAAGAFEAVRWCKARGLRVVVVTNTLSRGDVEALEDWRRFGLADAIDGVVSSHTIGWRKPHPAIFERALDLAKARPEEAFHVGDNIVADVWGAKELGLRAVWRRTESAAALGAAFWPPVHVRPDAVVRTLDELPAAVEPWLS